MRHARISAVFVLLALSGACGKDASPRHDADPTAGTGAGASAATAGDGANATLDAGDTQTAQDAAIGAHDAAAPTADGGTGADASTPDIRLPPDDGAFDYQLGGGYAPPAGVVTVSRDRTDSPAPGLYNICYINGFQVQPGEESSWDADLILRDSGGDPIVDPDWDEQLLDVSSGRTC